MEAVKIWNHEEKRQEVCRFIAENAEQYQHYRGMKKRQMSVSVGADVRIDRRGWF
ncbi:hypothetical protein [Leyella stercorea]|uniref:hypothetical protein n=1 Tax=Leyella stercorea TaxID=363265 RepID=UPI00266BB905|nr:hypothetical protein [Leyella stercorea]